MGELPIEPGTGPPATRACVPDRTLWGSSGDASVGGEAR
jgi:hypothetical protein